MRLTPKTTPPVAAVAAGTNGDGECVIEVEAVKGTTLGEHVVEITAAGLTKISTSIVVVGVTASIASDAPALVEPNSETEITVTGNDKNGDAVGPNVDASALIFEGSGALIQPAEAKRMTNDDGEYTFTYIAPSTAGTTSILVTVGGERDRILMTVGTEPVVEPDPDPDPEMMAHGFSTTLGSGVNLTSYTGSIGELAMDAAEAGVSVVAVAVDGEYITYIVGAPGFANEPFSDQFPDGLDGVFVVALVN